MLDYYRLESTIGFTFNRVLLSYKGNMKINLIM